MTTLPTTPSLRLDGRRALITGAARGLGFAMATALAQAGARVLLLDCNADGVRQAAAALAAHGLAAEAHAVDVTDRDGFARVAGAAPLDVLVNNAGIARHATCLEVTEADYDAVMAVNTKAAFFCAQTVARGMVAAGRGGSIINISSQMGHIGGPRRSVYCATKHAIEGFTKVMAIELGPHRIRVNSICPTFVRTELTRAVFADPDTQRWMADHIALGRTGVPEDLMGAVVFLASDASALMTGSALMLDGGWTAA